MRTIGEASEWERQSIGMQWAKSFQIEKFSAQFANSGTNAHTHALEHTHAAMHACGQTAARSGGASASPLPAAALEMLFL